MAGHRERRGGKDVWVDEWFNKGKDEGLTGCIWVRKTVEDCYAVDAAYTDAMGGSKSVSVARMFF